MSVAGLAECEVSLFLKIGRSRTQAPLRSPSPETPARLCAQRAIELQLSCAADTVARIPPSPMNPDAPKLARSLAPSSWSARIASGSDAYLLTAANRFFCGCASVRTWGAIGVATRSVL